MSLFDAYVFVDWSAKNERTPAHPTRDSIWVGEMSGGIGVRESYHRSRSEVFDSLVSILLRLTGDACHVLVGFDFPYGYPAGFGKLIPGQNGAPAWRRVWEKLSSELKDDDQNHSNRFDVASNLNQELGGKGGGPFWGCPQNRATRWLNTRSPEFPFLSACGTSLPRLRMTEQRIHGVQETWKLFGNGSVGSQALVGIPRVSGLRWRSELKGHSKIWPFETGFTSSPSVAKGPFILHAEIWPGIVKEQVRELLHAEPELIRDQAQVRCMCKWAALGDKDLSLGPLFDAPKELSQSALSQCIEEEGWILGLR